MIDLTTKLQNYALTCVGKADMYRREAAEIRAQATVTGWSPYDKATDLQIKTCEAQARAWEDRAVEARQGFLLYDEADVRWCFEHHDLLSEALAASRVRYVAPMASPAPPFVEGATAR